MEQHFEVVVMFEYSVFVVNRYYANLVQPYIYTYICLCSYFNSFEDERLVIVQMCGFWEIHFTYIHIYVFTKCFVLMFFSYQKENYKYGTTLPKKTTLIT